LYRFDIFPLVSLQSENQSLERTRGDIDERGMSRILPAVYKSILVLGAIIAGIDLSFLVEYEVILHDLVLRKVHKGREYSDR